MRYGAVGLFCGLGLLACSKGPAGARGTPAGASTPALADSAVAVEPDAWPRACDRAAPLRWLGSASNNSPHPRVSTPLAWGGVSVTTAGPRCCVPWSAKDVTWTALDRFGQTAGTARVAKSEYYDATECTELTLQQLSGTRGVELWVSSTAEFHPAKSAEWQPSAAQRRSLSALVKTLEGAMLLGPAWDDCDTAVRPANDRALFFRSHEGDGEREREHAVIGGPLLIIAERDPKRGGAWVASFVDTTDANACLPAHFTPKAVVDMNQDGLPEIVVHTDDGPLFGDLVYGFQQIGAWQVVARGVPGSTA